MEALFPLNYSPEAAPRRPALTGRREQQFTAGLVRAYVIPARVVRLLLVFTLCSYQLACTFTRRWCSAGMAGLEPATRSVGSCCSRR